MSIINEVVIQSVITTVMLMEVIKRFVKAKNADTPGWVFSLLMLFVSIGCTAASVHLPPEAMLYLMGIAVSQFGYQFILEEILALFKKLFHKEKL